MRNLINEKMISVFISKINLLMFLIFSVKIAVVEFDYQAKEPDELSLTKGQIITNIKVQSGGWWQGSLASNGKIGMFPDNFVKLIDSQNDEKVILRLVF